MIRISRIVFYFITMTLLIGCYDSEKLKHEISAEITDEVDGYIEKSSEYWKEFFAETNTIESEEGRQEFVSFFIEDLRRRSNYEIEEIVQSLELPTFEYRNILKCLKESTADKLAEDCEDKIEVILKPFANRLESLGVISYQESIKYLIEKTDHIRPTIFGKQCAKYRNGEFYTVDPFTSDTIKYVRKENEQLEISGGSVTKFDVNWIDECVYTLTSKNNMDSIVEVEIINEFDSGYRYISRNYIKGELEGIEVGVFVK